MKFITSIFLTLLTVSALIITPTAAAVTADGNYQITIFHTASVNGRVTQDAAEKTFGIAKLKPLKKSVPGSFLVDSGNYLSGHPMVSVSRGEDAVKFMNMAEYDVAGIDIGDLEYGFERLLELSAEARFKILSTNISRNGKPFTNEYEIKEADGIKIGFFSMTPDDIKTRLNISQIAELSFQDMYDVARRTANTLKRQGAQVVAAVSAVSSAEAEQIASMVQNIDVILAGGDEEPLRNGAQAGRLVGKTLVVSPGRNGLYVNRVVLNLNPDKVLTSLQTTLLSAENTRDIIPDEETETAVNELKTEIDILFEEEIGSAAEPFLYETAPGLQTNSHPLGNFIADTIREKTAADIAVINAGDIKSGLNAGKITKANIMDMLEVGRTVQTKTITPKILRDALENGINEISLDINGKIDYEHSASAKFPQISGFKVYYNPNNDVGDKVVKIVLDNGKTLQSTDDKTHIKIASTDFILGGGEGYDIFAAPETNKNFGLLEDMLIEKIKETGALTPTVQERTEISDKRENRLHVFIIPFIVLLSLIAVIVIIVKVVARFT
jgi:5'-nucleotidase